MKDSTKPTSGPAAGVAAEELASTDYFSHVRTDIADLLPQTATRILELGCAGGATLRWVKTLYPGAHTTGIDGFGPNREAIEKNADAAIITDLDQPLPPLGKFDLILALDVLEHLRDADGVLKALVRSNLAPEGIVIVSVPAISHWSVSAPLLFKRQFTYADAGILDRTHVRFFVEASSVGLLEDAGLRFTGGLLAGLEGARTRLLNRLTGGLLKHWLTKQYIVRGALKGQGRAGWGLARKVKLGP